MEVRWSPRAAEELSRIVEHVRIDSLETARQIAETVYQRAGALREFPYRGRTGRVQGTRELPLPPLPFVVVYRVLGAAIEIVHVINGAQRWP